MEREGDEPYRVSLSDTVILYDTLVYGIELPVLVVNAINRKIEQYYISEEYKFRVEREDASRNARRSRPKAYAISSRLSAKGYRTPTCDGAASRRRFSSHNPRIRRS